MRLYVTGVFVDDQRKALAFYTQKLGFEKKTDVPAGEYSWLTVTSKGDSDGMELLLEPSNHPAVGPYRTALVADGIPAASFQVDDIDAEYKRLCDEGVVFTQPPLEAGDVKLAVLDDTCGNLIQLIEMTSKS